jgi:hypothetical protein
MAINVSFNGATIYKPGAYSKTQIDLGGGFPLSATGLVAIMGEAEAGAPGANELDLANNVFSPDQMAQIREKYKSGPIVDACNMLFSPGADGAIPGGASAIYVYKTNSSERATLDVADDYGTVRAMEWGTGGNKITLKCAAVAETAATLSGAAISFPLVIGLSNNQLKIALDGEAVQTITIGSGSVANVTALAAAINAAAPAGTIVASAGEASNTLKLTQAAGTDLHKLGAGRSMMVTDGSANEDLGLTDMTVALPASEPKTLVTIKNSATSLTESSLVGGEIVMSMGRDSSGGCTSAEVSIDEDSVILTQTGATPSTITLSKADYGSVQVLVDYVNTLAGWSASAGSTLLGNASLASLDRVSSAGALSQASGHKPARIKRDAAKTAELFALSSLVEMIPMEGETETKKVGLMDEQGVPNALYLSGGAKGATSSAEIVNALSKIEKVRVNSVVPLFSRDASDDAADGLTDGSSSYTIDGIHQAVKTHLSLMATTKKRSERQGYLSLKASYEACKEKAANLADARIQLAIQDIRQADSQGAIKWFQPWAGAALLAGARGGSPIGLPMTFKFFNMSGIRQTGQSMSTAEQDIAADFDPDTMYDDAIQNGVTFWERPQTGGFRLVLDNTTYGKDGNWVYNRAHVLYAADVLAFDFRNQLENIYVGVKNTVTAAEVKSTCESILGTYLAQGITVSTADAKNGFKQLVVQINGNTINVSVVVKLVEGIDFVLADITLQRASQTA